MADREKLIELLKSGGLRDFPFNAALADHLIANGITVTDNNVGSKVTICFQNFEIRPTAFLDGHIDQNKFDVVKWYDHEPLEAINLKTGKRETSTRSCYSIAHIYWDEKEPCWEFSSVGTRFLEDYEEGLCEFIREWLELIGEPKGE